MIPLMRKYLIGLLVLGAACGTQADPPWKELSAASNLFVISGPGEPKTETINEYQPPFGTITGKQYNWQPPSHRFYLAMSMTFPAKMVPQMDMAKATRNILDGIAKRSNATVGSDKPVTVRGLPGLEYELKLGVQPGSMRVRTFENNGTIYVLAAGWPTGKQSTWDEEKFFDSFNLKQ